MLSRRDCCCRDPDDDTILALAATGRADVIITEDDDLLVLNPFDGIRILRPREFWSWAAAPVDAPRQQQVIVAVARDAGRVAPIVALIDHHDLGAALEDAFVLPDMLPARLDREVLGPMTSGGLVPVPMSVADACTAVSEALSATLALGHEIPSNAYQPVAHRLRRALTGDIAHGAG